MICNILNSSWLFFSIFLRLKSRVSEPTFYKTIYIPFTNSLKQNDKTYYKPVYCCGKRFIRQFWKIMQPIFVFTSIKKHVFWVINILCCSHYVSVFVEVKISCHRVIFQNLEFENVKDLSLNTEKLCWIWIFDSSTGRNISQEKINRCYHMGNAWVAP